VRLHPVDRVRRLLACFFVLGVLAACGGNAFALDTTTPGATTAAIPADTSPATPPVACNVTAADVPDDNGGKIGVEWTLSDESASPTITRFEILRFSSGGQPDSIGQALRTDRTFTDEATVDGTPYQYVVRTHTAIGFADSEASQAAVSSPQWFAMGRSSILVIGLLFSAAVLIFIQRARHGASLFIRKIPGLDAVDDAVGRATEMGRPVLYVPGIETVSEVGTLAALTILGHVAKRVAQHGTPLIVPCSDAIVMTTAQEIVKTAYAEVGQSDNYDPSRISYLTYDQFGYAAGVDGIMMRERPEAVFLLGYFAAESLILAETGHEIGAIQIAGTKETSQLPFFVAACDYTLIGEELFAASSYLSREPVMLGSLKGQDLAKLWIVYFMIFGFVVGTVGLLMRPDGSSPLSRFLEALRAWFQ
jgi:hypothetical protein